MENNCTLCDFLRSKMKFDSKRYFCRFKGCITDPNKRLCEEFKPKTENYSEESTCVDYGIDPSKIPPPVKLD